MAARSTPDRPAPDPSSNGASGPAAAPLPSAAPPTGARLLAVASIVVAGLCGGLIGYGFVDLQAASGTGPDGDGASTLAAVSGGVIGAVVAAVGVAVVAVLALRAMTEWRTIEDRARAEGREPPTRRASGRSR